jgi:hypothetical protein
MLKQFLEILIKLAYCQSINKKSNNPLQYTLTSYDKIIKEKLDKMGA